VSWTAGDISRGALILIRGLDGQWAVGVQLVFASALGTEIAAM